MPPAISISGLSLDWIALILLVHFTGGLESPIIYFFIFHVIIGSLILPQSVVSLIIGCTLTGMLGGVFHLHEQEAREVMTPIPAVITVDASETVEAALAGAHVCTLPPAVLRQLLKHPLTDIGLERFLADWKKVPKAG